MTCVSGVGGAAMARIEIEFVDPILRVGNWRRAVALDEQPVDRGVPASVERGNNERIGRNVLVIAEFRLGGGVQLGRRIGVRRSLDRVIVGN